MGNKFVKEKSGEVASKSAAIVGTTSKYGQKRLIVVITGALIVLGILSWGIYAYAHRSKAIVPTVALPSNLTTPEQKAAFYAQHDDYPSARYTWLQELKTSNKTDDKLRDYSELVDLALQFNNYADGQKYANAAKKLAPKSPTPYVLLARVAMAKGDKTNAKKYWEQAISNVDKSKPGSNILTSSYRSHLDSLK